eukprot:2642140-Prymnesium_polylepis.1
MQHEHSGSPPLALVLHGSVVVGTAAAQLEGRQFRRDRVGVDDGGHARELRRGLDQLLQAERRGRFLPRAVRAVAGPADLH